MVGFFFYPFQVNNLFDSRQFFWFIPNVLFSLIYKKATRRASWQTLRKSFHNFTPCVCRFRFPGRFVPNRSAFSYAAGRQVIHFEVVFHCERPFLRVAFFPLPLSAATRPRYGIGSIFAISSLLQDAQKEPVGGSKSPAAVLQEMIFSFRLLVYLHTNNVSQRKCHFP